MQNSSTLVRALAAYAIVLPLAVFIGYLLANPLSYSTIYTGGIIAFALSLPLLMKWHYPLVLLSWNMNLAGILFLPGSPNIWLLLVLLSFGMAVFERALNRNKRFIHVPQLTWPLLALVAVILVTAKLTGGFGLRSLGGEVYGGKKYVHIFAGILSFFVLTSLRIPKERVNLYIALFFLGGVTNFIGDLFPITPKALQFIFWFFPPHSTISEFEVGVTRLRGTAVAGFAAYCWMMARYGIHGIFLSGRIWRLLAFVVVFAISLLGGFRSTFLAILLVFVFQFFLEGLHRSKLLPMFMLIGVLAAAVALPFASKLPFTFQRALAFLPIELDPVARANAEATSEWRLQMWKALLPQVSEHLLLGKGYAISKSDYQMMGHDTSFKAFDISQEALTLSYDYHNGPLSVLIPFGIWGTVAFGFFVCAGIWVVYRNFRYGDPDLKLINTFLLAVSLKHLIMFLFVFGGINGDMAVFAGFFGLSVALNGGVRRPAQASCTADARESIARQGLRRPMPGLVRS